jgi:hypothetical protein
MLVVKTSPRLPSQSSESRHFFLVPSLPYRFPVVLRIPQAICDQRADLRRWDIARNHHRNLKLV